MEASGESSIHKFFENSEIFVTGGSGFVGRVLVEKLLRTCKGVRKIWLLMRPKKGADPWTRVDRLSSCKLFEKLKATDPAALSKLSIVEGDVSSLNLSLSASDQQKLKNCSVIFHCAASVRFDDPIKDAILLNTRGTREVCKIAEKLANLKAVVHVSTSFVQPQLYGLDEVFYEADCSWSAMIKIAETFDGELLNSFEKKLTKFAPNTYTFSKHLAEQVCEHYKQTKNLPIVIYRPSVIAGSEVEPFPGWLDNLYGPLAFAISAGMGVNHVSHVDGEISLDYVPVDICVKGMLVAAWKTWRERTADVHAPIYNACSIKITSFNSLQQNTIVQDYPPLNAIMYCDHHHLRCRLAGWVIRVLEQIIPAMIFDGLLKLSGQRAKMMRYQRIIYDSFNKMTAFTSRNFNFTNFRFIDLNKEIPASEKNDFFMDEKYPQQNNKQIKEIYQTILEVVFNQKPEDLPRAKARYFYVKLFSRIYQVLAYFCFFYVVYKILEKTVLKIDFYEIFRIDELDF